MLFGKRQGVTFLISLVPIGLFMTLMGGLYDMAIQRLDGYPIQATDVFRKMAKFPFFLGAYFLTMVLTFVGSMLCVIPGLFLMGVLAFVPLIIARKNVGVIEAVTLSWNTLKPHAFPMFALVFVTHILGSLGVMACGVGLLFTAPIPIIVLAMHYRYFFPSQPYAGWQQPVAGPPPTPPFDG